MADRAKDVMVYRYDPKKKYFLVTLSLENKPGALGNVADVLAVRGINILEGFFGGISSGSKGNMSFFLESTNPSMDEEWLKDFISSSVYVSDVQVRSGVEGFLSDTFNFPITWNNGDRAVLMRVEGLRAMLDAVKSADPEAGAASVYAQGFSYGKWAYDNLLAMHRPKTKEGLAELLKLYLATGWGKTELVDFDPGHKRARIRMKEGFECGGLSTGNCESNFIRGHLAGALSSYFDTDLKGVETKCGSKGDEYCEFEISP